MNTPPPLRPRCPACESGEGIPIYGGLLRGDTWVMVRTLSQHGHAHVDGCMLELSQGSPWHCKPCGHQWRSAFEPHDRLTLDAYYELCMGRPFDMNEEH